MQQKVTKLSLNDMTQIKIYKTFGLRQVATLPSLTHWLSDLPELTELEKNIAEHYQERLLDNINVWNEQELSLNFIGPIFAIINFTVAYRLNWFAQRTISAQIGNYLLSGKPDGLIASGYLEPEKPFFSFQEFKKELDNSGDPIGQNLAAMLIGQAQNDDQLPVYGCYIAGRNWFFMVLEGKNYAISKVYAADDEELFHIVRIVKKLRNLFFKRLKIN